MKFGGCDMTSTEAGHHQSATRWNYKRVARRCWKGRRPGYFNDPLSAYA